jgi:hypothetical protein
MSKRFEGFADTKPFPGEPHRSASKAYEHQEYPKHVTRADGATVTVNSLEEEEVASATPTEEPVGGAD